MGDCYTKTVRGIFKPWPYVPTENAGIDSNHEKLANLGDYWFYDSGSADDPAFGFNGIAVRLTQLDGDRVAVRLTYTNNGYQGGSGSTPFSAPISLVFRIGDYAEAAIEGIPYNVPCGSGDFHQWEGTVATRHFDQIDSVEIPAASGFSVTC